MLELLERCFPRYWKAWEPRILEIVPSYGTSLADDPAFAREIHERTVKLLELDRH